MAIFSNPIVAFLLLIGVLVFVHELGHYLIGKLFGVGVRVFSIGFGPRLFGFVKDNTDFSIRAIPVGGFVQFAGVLRSEEVEEVYQGKEYWRAKPWQRALILLAGPLANILMAVAVFALLGFMGIEHLPAQVGEVKSGSPAEIAELQTGDKIVAIDSKPVQKWSELTEIVRPAAGKTLRFDIERNGKVISKNIVPEAFESEALNGDPITIGRIGIEIGMAPPVLAIESSNGFDFGFRSGDKIIRIEFSSGEALEPKTWFDIDSFFQKNKKSFSSADHITFTVEKLSAPPKGDAKPQPQQKPESRSIAISRADLVTQEYTDIQSVFGIYNGRQVIAEIRGENVPVKIGDVLLSVKDSPIRDRYDLLNIMKNNTVQTVPIKVLRGKEVTELSLKLQEKDIQKATGKETIFIFPFAFVADAYPEPLVEKYENFVEATFFGLNTTINKSQEMVGHIAGLFTGEIPLKALGGPILIAQVASSSVEHGVQTFLATIAAISINLGLINLVPIPALDGGQLVVVGAEWIRRKPLSEQAIENIQRVGAVMVLALMVLAFYNDLGRFWSSMLSSMTGSF